MPEWDETGGDYEPEPIPEATPENPPEAPAEVVSGENADLISEGLDDRGNFSPMKVAEATADSLTEEFQSRLSEQGLSTQQPPLEIGPISDNPEHAAGDIAAAKQRMDDQLANAAKAAEDQAFQKTEAENQERVKTEAIDLAERERERAESAARDAEQARNAPPSRVAELEALGRNDDNLEVATDRQEAWDTILKTQLAQNTEQTETVTGPESTSEDQRQALLEAQLGRKEENLIGTVEQSQYPPEPIPEHLGQEAGNELVTALTALTLLRRKDRN